jgi:colanic acid/amylovoran biosynthesis glycosyltransferase
MRIVYVTVYFPFGTRETFLIPELRELRAQGHEVLIVPLRPDRGPIHPDAAELIHCARYAPFLSLGVLRAAAVEFCRNIRPALKIMRLFLQPHDFRAMAINATVIPKGLWLSAIARAWGAHHIHAYWASSAAGAALIAGESTGIPWSFTGHRHDIAAGNLLAEKMRHAAFARMISASGLRMLRSVDPHLLSKAFVGHLGIPIPPLPSPREKAGGTLTALCPANMVAVKGHSYLIEAMAMLRNAGVDMKLWLAGDGELRGQIERKVRELHVQDSVRFLGHLPHQTLLSLYRDGEVDMVVLPSLDLGNGHHEGIPVALMEPMAYAIPVVATNTGGIPELIGDGAGLLVEPSNPRELAGALAKLASNAGVRRSLGLAGRQRVEQSFEITQMVRGLVGRFDQSASAGGTRPAPATSVIERIAS